MENFSATSTVTASPSPSPAPEARAPRSWISGARKPSAPSPSVTHPRASSWKGSSMVNPRRLSLAALTASICASARTAIPSAAAQHTTTTTTAPTPFPIAIAIPPLLRTPSLPPC